MKDYKEVHKLVVGILRTNNNFISGSHLYFEVKNQRYDILKSDGVFNFRSFSAVMKCFNNVERKTIKGYAHYTLKK
jgi:hypothetical protein